MLVLYPYDNRSFSNLQYRNVRLDSFNSIQIEIRDMKGNLIPFTSWGIVVLNLHFRKKANLNASSSSSILGWLSWIKKIICLFICFLFYIYSKDITARYKIIDTNQNHSKLWVLCCRRMLSTQNKYNKDHRGNLVA